MAGDTCLPRDSCSASFAGKLREAFQERDDARASDEFLPTLARFFRSPSGHPVVVLPFKLNPPLLVIAV